MNAQTQIPLKSKCNKGVASGIALIAIGLLALAGQFIDAPMVGLLFLPALAAIFLVWGLVTRTFGLIIPGGILAGLGLGTMLTALDLPWLAGVDEGALFLMAFAAGWALITLLSPLTGVKTQWWPLIPGGIIAAIGALVLLDEVGRQVLALSSVIWPLALVLLGVWILLRNRP